jgi:hypothetical protein
MSDDMNITIEAIARHRNGVSGEPFHVVTFRWAEDGDEPRPMVGIVFDTRNHVAVLDREETRRGNIAFAEGNSWRGDHYLPQLRAAIDAWEAARPDPLDAAFRRVVLREEEGA